VILAFNVLAEAVMAFYWHQAGVLARIALALLPASSCSRCWRCTGVVAELPIKVRPVLRKHLPVLRLHFSSILLASLPALCCCPCHRHCACIITMLRGAFALVAPASLSSLPLPCTSIATLRLPSHETVATRACVIASTVPLSLPAIAGIVALVTWAFLPL
jgi:hypothetical protein